MSIAVMLLCTVPGEEKWVHLKDSREKELRIKIARKEKILQYVKCFLRYPESTLVAHMKLTDHQQHLLGRFPCCCWHRALTCVRDTAAGLAWATCVRARAWDTVYLCYPSMFSFGEWSNCCLPLYHLPHRKTATNFLLCNSPWNFEYFSQEKIFYTRIFHCQKTQCQ